eukprot:gene17223-biopygen18861
MLDTEVPLRCTRSRTCSSGMRPTLPSRRKLRMTSKYFPSRSMKRRQGAPEAYQQSARDGSPLSSLLTSAGELISSKKTCTKYKQGQLPPPPVVEGGLPTSMHHPRS